MCGITGYTLFQNESAARDAVQLMNNAIAHRGPDAEGLFSNAYVALGHRRLSIIDTSPAGNQPFFSDDRRIVMVFNGEIYNYLELKEELADFTEFKTASDTEVIIAAYRKWGIQCIDKLIGMFAFALWDENEKVLFIVRDRLGVKPLYYAHMEKGLLFSSEMRAIMRTGIIALKVSADGLADYLKFQTVHAPATILEGIQMLMPGHYLIIRGKTVQTKQYWASEKNVASRVGASEEEVKKDIYDLLHSSVELRMRADVPFGAFLSGGIDSSVVVGLMSRIATQPVKTFSITFHEKEFDESTYSSMIAKKFGTDHTEIKLHATSFLEALPDALNAMDHPSGDGPNTYVVSGVTRKAGVKMALSGLGGDELFAGYAIFNRMMSLEQQRLLALSPAMLRRIGAGFLQMFKPGVAGEKIAETLRQEKIDFAHVYPIHRMVLMQKNIERLLRVSRPNNRSVELITEKIAATNLPLLSKVSVAEITTYMQNVLLRDTDQMSMAHALEVREPFLDHRLIEYVLAVPDQWKNPTTPKRLLVEAMGDLLPDEVVNRPKMGFTFPWSLWMKKELKSFCEEQLEVLDNHPLFRKGEVWKLWEAFLQNDPKITWSRLWPMVVLGHWIKKNNVD